MSSLWLRVLFSCCALFVVSAAQAKPPSVEQIIVKCLAAYDKVRTYQGMLIITEKFPKRSAKMTIEIKAQNGKNGMIQRSAMNMKASTGLNVRMLDDGRMLYAANIQKKEYQISPRRPDKISGLLRESLSRTLQLKSALTVSEGKKGRGRVYIISGSPNNRPVKMLVNASNFQLESLQVNRMQGKEASTMRMEFIGQKFNAAIPARVFVWKAPAGYKKR